ncbi:MAG: AAA family ATPase [Candidatus Yanofskybacteria bacterium]|nr:AAA family ATPase [Candidatus Yanofskybacteria bacterium]
MNSSIIGHNKQKKYFSNIVKNDFLSHAYLLSGPEMIGKKLFTIDLYEKLNGRSSENDPDFKLITPKVEDGETKLYIEDIRDIKKFLSYKPYSGPQKVVVIDDAHRLTNEASNALLKALEEPSAFSILFLITHMPKSLPSTILSRCEEVTFLPAQPAEVAEFLRSKNLNKQDEDFLIKISFGRLGLIERLLRDDGLDSAKIAVEDLRKLLSRGISEKIDYAKIVHENKTYVQTVGYWLNWLYANLNNSPKNTRIVRNLLELNYLVSQPQFNHRLALENFLINL